MGRSYSQYPFHQQQPALGVQGSGARLGNDEDKQKQLKSEVPDPHTEEKKALTEGGGIHYGMKHAETVKRLQARRAKRAQEEARGKAAAKRPTGKRAAGTATAKKATSTSRTAAKKATPPDTATAKKASGTAAKKATTPAKKDDTGTAARKTPATAAKAPRGGALSRLVGAVMQGTKGVVRQAALAKQARLGKKADKPGPAKKKK